MEPEAQGDNGAIVVTAPGSTLTLQPSAYTTVAEPPGLTMTESPTLASAAVDRLETLTLIDREVALAGLNGGGPGRTREEPRYSRHRVPLAELSA